MQFTTIISKKVNMPEDQVRLITAVILCTPFSYVLYWIRNKTLKTLFSLVIGTLLQLFVYYEDTTQFTMIIIQTIFVYFFTKYNRKNCGFIITVESILMLSFFHIYRQITNYGSWKLDTTTILMNLVCKYSQFAYAYQDGAAKYKLSQEQQQLKIVQIPSFYSYINYIQFLPTTVMGPSCEYKQYQNYMNRKQLSPNPIKQVLKSFAGSLLFIVLYLFVYQKYFSIQYLKSDDFFAKSGFYKFYYAALSVTFIRTKYYFAWKLSSCAIHACGISYRVIQKKQDYEGLVHAHPQIVESTYHIRQKIANWNMSCQAWLRKSIYLRFGNQQIYKKNKSLQAKGQLLVFMVSAFWHGFYGGYYLSFFFWFTMVHLSTTVFKIVNNYPIIQKSYQSTGIIGKIMFWIFANSFFSYYGFSFQLMSLRASYNVLKSLYFIPQIGLFIITILLTMSGLQNKKKEKKAE